MRSMAKRKKLALITGIFGQDGSYLLELLHGNGYEVHGIAKEKLSVNSVAIRGYLAHKGIEPNIHTCSLNSYAEVRQLMEVLQPDECYHLAATHFSSQTKGTDKPGTERDLFDNVWAVMNILQAIREYSPDTRMVYAGSCLMFARADHAPQNEATPYRSCSMYGLSKITGGQLVEFFRTTHCLHASTAILYNHESPRRPAQFASKKIVSGIVRVANGTLDHLTLGNLNSMGDWGYAKDYARGMWMMAQQVVPGDYVLATGEGHTVEDFVRHTAQCVGLPAWREYVHLDQGLTSEPPKIPLIGDATLAKKQLGWEPSRSFNGLIELMIDNEMRGQLD
jgi:GDPmannose 4,6-dehydratase